MPDPLHQLKTAAADLHRAADNLDPAVDPQQRDWKSFFEGLAQLLQVLLPVIIPLFAGPKPSDENK